MSVLVPTRALVGAGLPPPTPAAWTLFGLLIVSGLFGTIALMRVGMRHFWTAQDRPAPRLRVIETLPIAGLLAASMALVLQADAGPACTLMQ